jgi:hypothetical protein
MFDERRTAETDRRMPKSVALAQMADDLERISPSIPAYTGHRAEVAYIAHILRRMSTEDRRTSQVRERRTSPARVDWSELVKAGIVTNLRKDLR